MQYIYAPWRSEYVKGETKTNSCVFCDILTQNNDEDLGVLYRKKDYFFVMNKYPYTPGHFMIIPNKHISSLEELDTDIWLDINKDAKECVKMLKEVLNATGVNLGMNLGKAAGAGIKEHIHLHLVPRWIGDTNFITTIGDSRVFSTDFNHLYQKLKQNILKYIS